MVITGAQMHVAPQAAFFPADNQDHLGVGFVPDHTVNHDHAGFLQPTGQLQVLGFAETGSQFDNRRHFLASTRGIGQGLDNFRVGTGAIKRLANGQHLRVLGRLAQQVHHRAEVFIGM